MTDQQAKEFIDGKKDHYIENGYEEIEAESLAYCDLEEYLEKNNLILELA